MPPSGRATLVRALAQLPVVCGDALDQIRAHWRQHALALAGIIWGAAALILLLSLGVAFNSFLDVGFASGGDRWTVMRGGYSLSRSGGARPGQPIVLEVEDLRRVEGGAASAVAVAGELLAVVPVETARHTRGTVVSAASAPLDVIQNHRVALGRWFDEEDDRSGRRVAVLGHNLVEPLFGSADPIGSTVQVDGVPFDVIGVLKRKGVQLFSDEDLHDNMVFIPLTAGQRALEKGDTVGRLILNPANLEDADAMRTEVRTALSALHHLPPDDPGAFVFHSIRETIEPIIRVGLALQVLLGLIGTVTLAMAGVAVANLMTAIVSSRRREFATRRACGARHADVVLQLLVESVVVVLAGGLVGCGLGLLLVAILNAVPLPDMLPPPRVVPSVVITTFAVLVGTGLAAGVIPARIASRVDPASAMRAI